MAPGSLTARAPGRAEAPSRARRSRPDTSPSSLRRSVSSSARPTAGPLGHAGGQQVVARDLEPHAAEVGHPAEDRLGRRPQREGQRERLERLPGEQRAQLGWRVLALAERLRDPWRDARGARGRVALVGQQVQVGEPQVELLGGALHQRGERAHSPVGADRRRAERRRGHEIGVRVELGMERGVDLEVADQLDRPPDAPPPATAVHQLAADPRSRHRRQRIGGDRLARESLRLRLEREAEPRCVANRAQQARGIVDGSCWSCSTRIVWASRSPSPPCGS